MTNQTRIFYAIPPSTKICTGCGKEFKIVDIRIMGPDTLHPPQRTFWCYNPLCISKQRIFSARVRRKLDEQGRKVIEEARKAGDKELEEAAMLIYMCDKMERIEDDYLFRRRRHNS